MKLEITFPDSSVSDFEAQALALFESKREPLELAMAKRFHEMTLSNFGVAGVDRPVHWKELSPAYAAKVKRTIATLYVSGSLKGAVHQEGNEVFVSNGEVPYALAHQYGYAPNNLPARPYFPIDESGECMPYTLSQVVDAAQNELTFQIS